MNPATHFFMKVPEGPRPDGKPGPRDAVPYISIPIGEKDRINRAVTDEDKEALADTWKAFQAGQKKK